MKLRITEKGADGHEVDDEIEIKGDRIPSALVNKCVRIDPLPPEDDLPEEDKDTNGKDAVINPAKGGGRKKKGK